MTTVTVHNDQLSAQLTAGSGVVPVPDARKPKVAVAPVARRPFQLTSRAVATEPDCVTVAFHAWLICCPPVKASVAVQPEEADAEALRTVTSPWKPPVQEPVIRYAAEQPDAGGGVEDDGEAEAEAEADGEAEAEGEMGGVGGGPVRSA